MTGIDIELKASSGVGTALKVLHALHLDFLVEAGMSRSQLVVTLDGVDDALAIKGEHFLACAPGAHSLKVAFGGSLGTELSASAEVTVEPDQVTMVRFISHVGGLPTLEVVGTRPG